MSEPRESHMKAARQVDTAYSESFARKVANSEAVKLFHRNSKRPAAARAGSGIRPGWKSMTADKCYCSNKAAAPGRQRHLFLCATVLVFGPQSSSIISGRLTYRGFPADEMLPYLRCDDDERRRERTSERPTQPPASFIVPLRIA